MKIFEVQSSGVTQQKIMALSQFLLGRASNTDSNKTISLPTFINLANSLGISLSGQQLKDMSLVPPLSNLIDNVEIDPSNTNKGTVYLKGSQAAPGDEVETMTVDQARDTVDKMAKRAMKQ